VFGRAKTETKEAAVDLKAPHAKIARSGSAANFLSRVGWSYDRRAWGGRNSPMIDFKAAILNAT